MKFAVTGATGFIGQRLVRELLDSRHQVLALTRDPERAKAKLPVRCEAAAWNPTSGSLDPEVLAGCDAVVHLAGEGVADKPWTAARKQQILDSRVLSTRMLVQALSGLPAPRRPRTLVAASAIGFYGERGDDILSESAPAGSGFLAEVCQAWERESGAAQELGVRTAIVRIGVVLGRDGGALAKMLPPFQLGVGGRLGAGTHWMSWIHADDLVQLLIEAATNDSYVGVINGVAPDPVTNAEFTAALGRALHRPTLFPVPRLALNLMLGEMASILFASQRVVAEAAQRLGFRFQYGSIDNALADLLDGHHEIFAEQFVARPIEEVFDFFSDAHNLERITPPFLKFQVLRTSTPAIEEGTLIDYKLSLHGLPMRWQSRIESWVAGERFVDVQVKGPYQEWHHTHEFEAFGDGTIVRDRVRYRLPMGGFGDAIGGPLVQRDVQQIFEFRHQKIAEIFPTH